MEFTESPREVYLREHYVNPIYLGGMTNEKAGAIAQLARATPPTDVVELLGSAGWRQQRAGAYLAMAIDSSEITSALLTAVRTSRGWLTLPLLATVAFVKAGVDVECALRDFQIWASAAPRSETSSSRFAAAVLEILDLASDYEEADDKCRELLVETLAFMDQVRSQES